MNYPELNIWAFPLREIPMVLPFLLFVLWVLLLPTYYLLKKPRYIIAEPGLVSLALVWKSLLPNCLDVKVVLDIRSTIVEMERSMRGFLRSLLFDISVLVARSCFDGITTVTPFMKEEISKRFHIEPAFIGVWTSGVSTSLFEPAVHFNEGVRLRKQYNLEGKYVVFYHGAFTQHRGLIESVESIALLDRKYDDIVLFLLGNGPALSEIRAVIQRKNLGDRVIVRDIVEYEEVPKYIAMSDIGLVPLPDLPDWRCQCPLNLLEYLAMEKPVIATRIPANTTILGESESVVYARSAYPKEIARAIATSHDEVSVLRRLGFLGRTMVQHTYDWDVVALELEDFLKTR